MTTPSCCVPGRAHKARPDASASAGPSLICVEERDSPSAESGRRGILRQGLGLTSRALPLSIFALLPKCPMCLAAWIAAGTGLGISFTAAAWLRTLLFLLCLGLFAAYALRPLRRRLRRLRHTFSCH